MWFGVPQLILILLAIAVIVISMWTFILVSGYFAFVILTAGIFGYGILRFMSADDPHRLLQRGKQLQSWFFARWNKPYWGAHSASPLDTDRLRRIRE